MERDKGHYTRCKVRCDLYEGNRVVFRPVTEGSPENERFFKATPAGLIDLQVVNPRTHFDVGREYYVDFYPCTAPDHSR